MWPEDGQSLGLSIVGGRHIIKRLKNGEELKGIFIKQVLPNSPAAKTHCLKTGDKILEVQLCLIPGPDTHEMSDQPNTVISVSCVCVGVCRCLVWTYKLQVTRRQSAPSNQLQAPLSSSSRAYQQPPGYKHIQSFPHSYIHSVNT